MDFGGGTYANDTSDRFTLFVICSRPYFFKRIPYSNLLLVVVNTEHQSCNPYVTSSPVEIEYDEKFPCHKLKLNDLPRRRLDECFTEHPDVWNVFGKFLRLGINYFCLFAGSECYLLWPGPADLYLHFSLVDSVVLYFKTNLLYVNFFGRFLNCQENIIIAQRPSNCDVIQY